MAEKGMIIPSTGFADRLKALVKHVGDDTSVTVTGKSIRQIKRYLAGDEPQFGVLKSLSEHSGVTLDWLAFGRASTTTDHQLAITVALQEIGMLKRALKRAEDIDEIERIKAVINYNHRLVDLNNQWIDANEKYQADSTGENEEVGLGRSSGANRSGGTTLEEPSKAHSAHTVDPNLMEKLARLVAAVYRDAGMKLPGERSTLEAATLYNDLASRVTDIADAEEVEAILPQLRYQLKKRLSEAVAEPGTGKRSA